MKRLTVADLRALKGKRQLTMLRCDSPDEAAAAEQAGIDMISVSPQTLMQPGFRAAAPTVFCVTSLSYGRTVTATAYLNLAFESLRAGADAVYCAASTRVIQRLAEEGIPVCGHAGLIPAKATWTGGFKAVGKTVETARLVWSQVRDLERAGAFMAEIEVVPEAIAREIAKRSSLVLVSMGSGSGCDGQYLFACDVLGTHQGHYPRHARTYRHFAVEYERLQRERVSAFREFAGDVTSGEYPAQQHKVAVADEVLAAFVKELG
jgi:3-methyl-2-oxobutanoate hydroxymethyltransferase